MFVVLAMQLAVKHWMMKCPMDEPKASIDDNPENAKLEEKRCQRKILLPLSDQVFVWCQRGDLGAYDYGIERLDPHVTQATNG